MTERQRTQLRVKQDEIPRMERPGTDRGYYLFVEDDVGCLIEQPSGQTIQDTDTDQHLPTDLITEAEAVMYQVPEQDGPTIDDNAETISSTSTADYNHEEVETSLTTVSEAFHTIAQEYEKLTDTVPHMSKIQAAQVIARLPVLPILSRRLKKEKAEASDVIEIEPVPGTSAEQPAAELKSQQRNWQQKQWQNRPWKREIVNLMRIVWMNTSKNTCCLEKGKTPMKRFKKPVKR